MALRGMRRTKNMFPSSSILRPALKRVARVRSCHSRMACQGRLQFERRRARELRSRSEAAKHWMTKGRWREPRHEHPAASFIAVLDVLSLELDGAAAAERGIAVRVRGTQDDLL